MDEELIDMKELLEIPWAVVFGLAQVVIWANLFWLLPAAGEYSTVDLQKVILLGALLAAWIIISKVIGDKLVYGVVGTSIPQIAVPVLIVLLLLRMPIMGGQDLQNVCGLAVMGSVAILFAYYCVRVEKSNANGRYVNLLIPGLCVLCWDIVFVLYMYYCLYPMMESTDTSLVFAVRATFFYFGCLQTILVTIAAGFGLLLVRLIVLKKYQKRRRMEIDAMLKELWSSSRI